jgi:hypothetical protein
VVGRAPLSDESKYFVLILGIEIAMTSLLKERIQLFSRGSRIDFALQQGVTSNSHFATST